MTSPDTALADPRRRAIVERLSAGEATVAQLGEPFAISQPAISRRLRVLEDAGLVAGSARPRRRDPEGLRRAHDWLAVFRGHLEDSCARLDADLMQPERDDRP
jgi:DNA-binding transcriptional ArsR family regulator